MKEAETKVLLSGVSANMNSGVASSKLDVKREASSKLVTRSQGLHFSLALKLEKFVAHRSIGPTPCTVGKANAIGEVCVMDK